MRYNGKKKSKNWKRRPAGCATALSCRIFAKPLFPFEKKAFLDWASYQNGQEAAELTENQHGAQGC
jgi:hypothetical protein